MTDNVAGGPTLDDGAAAATGTDSDPHTSSQAAGTEDCPKNEKLTDLIARATAAYAIKDYSPAAELYSQATELQVEMNGEMSLENADLLYSYGKCLYFVAVSNSDVLGGTAASAKIGNSNPEKKVTKKRKLNGESSTTATAPLEQSHQAVQATISLPESVANGAADGITVADPNLKAVANAGQDTSKPYFQFTGDDKDWGDSDEDEDEEADQADTGAANGAGEEEEEDDFANAYEILDLARVLFLRRLDALREADRNPAIEESSKNKWVPPTSMDPKVRDIKERLADVHDLQAEISLEGEKFENAVTELKAALALKEELYPLESAGLAECHYKLSLALEFSSIKQDFDENGNPKDSGTVDTELREQAALQMEKAIASCKARIRKELTILGQSLGQPHAEMEKKRLHIADVREMVADMEQRLVDLRKPPVSVREAERAAADEENGALSGILGQILAGGTSQEEKKRLLDEAARGATDLSNLVVKKNKKKKPNNLDTNGGVAAESVSEQLLSASATPDPNLAPTVMPANANVNVKHTGKNENGSASPNKRKVEFVDEVDEYEIETGTGNGKGAKRARVDAEAEAGAEAE